MLTLDTSLAEFAEFCRMIDEGDDSVLPILADLLEDRGDWRAEALREIIRCELHPKQDEVSGWYWAVYHEKAEDDGAHLIYPLYLSLVYYAGLQCKRLMMGTICGRYYTVRTRYYGKERDRVSLPTRSQAYLILAAAAS